MTVLLDTHILIWWIQGSERLSSAQREALDAIAPDAPCLVSDITLWEVAMLVQNRRIGLRIPLRDWLEAATAPPLVRRVPITPAIAATVAELPPQFHKDPADRILVATARVMGVPLVTADQRIRESGLVPVV